MNYNKAEVIKIFGHKIRAYKFNITFMLIKPIAQIAEIIENVVIQTNGCRAINFDFFSNASDMASSTL